MVSGLFRPKCPPTAIGFGNGTVAVVSISKSGRDRFRVKRAASTELPASLVSPSFDEQNISDELELATIISSLAEEAGLKGQKKWSATLPAATARTAIITLDETPASKTELNEILDWKSESSFGASTGDLRVSRYRISPAEDGRNRYFATAVKWDVLEEYDRVFAELGWRIGLMVPKAVGESNWFARKKGDSLLISAQPEGFTALLMRDSEPVVVRTVTCGTNDLDDEIYRLLVYYQDRVSGGSADGRLSRLLVIGEGVDTDRIDAITSEALGESQQSLDADGLGFEMPVGGMSFEDLAAPAGLATLNWG